MLYVNDDALTISSQYLYGPNVTLSHINDAWKSGYFSISCDTLKYENKTTISFTCVRIAIGRSYRCTYIEYGRADAISMDYSNAHWSTW